MNPRQCKRHFKEQIFITNNNADRHKILINNLKRFVEHVGMCSFDWISKTGCSLNERFSNKRKGFCCSVVFVLAHWRFKLPPSWLHTRLIWCTCNVSLCSPICPFVSPCKDNAKLQQPGLSSSFHVSLSVGLVQTCPRFHPIRCYCPTTCGQWAVRLDRGLVKRAAPRAQPHIWCNETWFNRRLQISLL